MGQRLVFLVFLVVLLLAVGLLAYDFILYKRYTSLPLAPAAGSAQGSFIVQGFLSDGGRLAGGCSLSCAR